jgi:hypothetical protein
MTLVVHNWSTSVSLVESHWTNASPLMTYIKKLICSSFAQTYWLQVPMYYPNYLLNVNGSQYNPMHIKGAIENLQVSNMFFPSNILV